MPRTGDPDAAQRELAAVLYRFAANAKLLHLTGMVRMHQQRYREAADLLAHARTAEPPEAVLAYSHGTALRWLEQHGEAAEALRDATKLKPDYAEGYYEAGTI